MKKIFSIIIVLLLTFIYCSNNTVFADEVSDLQKVLNEVKLGEKITTSYLYLPQKASNGFIRYEGQLGKLALIVFTSPENDTISRVAITIKGIHDELLPITIDSLGKPTSSTDKGVYKEYTYSGENSTWDLTLFYKPYGEPPHTFICYQLNSMKDK